MRASAYEPPYPEQDQRVTHEKNSREHSETLDGRHTGAGNSSSSCFNSS